MHQFYYSKAITGPGPFMMDRLIYQAVPSEPSNEEE